MIRTLTGWIARGLAIAAALLATVQPVLGSLAFFRSGDSVKYETLHLVFGGILYNCALLLALLATFSTLRRRRLIFALSIVQYALLHLQLRLGLGSNEDGELLAYHIPVGVLVFFVAYLTLALVFDLLRLPSRLEGREGRAGGSGNGLPLQSPNA